MLLSLFLSRVAQAIKWSLCAASDLAASSFSSGAEMGSSASGMPSAVLAITRASRSSVLASPANNLDASCAAMPGRYATGSPASLARLMGSDPMLRTWSTTTSVCGPTCENSASSSFSALPTGLFKVTSPSLVAQQAQCENLPTSMPRTAVHEDASGTIMVVSS